MKKIFLLFMAFISLTPVFAQDDGEEVIVTKKEKSNAFFIGPKAGGVLTTMTQPEQCDLYDGSEISFSGGLTMKVRFGKASANSQGGTGMFGAGLELKYKKNKVKTVGTDDSGNDNAKFSVGYFEVPVFAHFYPLAKNKKFNTLYIETGPCFAGTLNRSPKSLTVNGLSGEYSQVKYNLENEDKKLKGMDIRILFGLGYTIPGTGLDINARYYLGTSKLAENLTSRMNSLEVSLAWLFNVGKF